MLMSAVRAFHGALHSRVQELSLTHLWGMKLNHLNIASLLEQLESGNQCNRHKDLSVRLGSRVTLVEKQSESLQVFTLVGPSGSAPEKGKLSCFSALGAELMGKTVGETVQFSVLCREVVFKIVRIEQP
ncbi:GreA/GreB family elongation factor [Gilvimarinus sp. F26214L]|uniref:GreA/GreB family elongation factor n=1 Tax=Gilvimarinus sp. DZF01 TaxID=3461371 RepID=UPI004046118C